MVQRGRMHLPMHNQFKQQFVSKPLVLRLDGPPQRPASFTLSDGVKLCILYQSLARSRFANVAGGFGFFPTAGFVESTAWNGLDPWCFSCLVVPPLVLLMLPLCLSFRF
jgi:hypothetical protein